MRKYWKISPGDNARFWDRCKKDKNIAVGWGEFLGDYDLSTFIGRKDEFEKYYVEKYKDRQRAQLKSQMRQLWNFINLCKGDIVIANRGMKSIVGIGRVTGPYKHRSEYPEYRHTVQVDWYKTDEKNILENNKDLVKDWWSLTLKELTDDEYMKLMENKVSPTSIGLKHLVYSLLESKKQIILYGPPGTGKTYNTQKYAASLISNIEEQVIEPFDLPEEETNEHGVPSSSNPLTESLVQYVRSLPGIEEKLRANMAGYYSVSNKNHKKIGLVWISPQKDKSLRIFIRKEFFGKYPTEIKSMPIYRENGWGGYPEFRVKNNEDVKKAVTFIKFAYDNL